MTLTSTSTSTMQQRKPLAQEVEAEAKKYAAAAAAAAAGVVNAAAAAIPNESDSDNEKDVTRDDDPDTDWIASGEVKKKLGHHADEIDRSKLDASTRAFMEKVDACIAKFEVADDAVAWQLVYPPVIGFILLTLLAPFVLTQSFLISGTWLFLAGGLRVRLFIIFHDCGHGCFFSKFKDNMRVGKFLELFVATPFALWLKRHNRHHRVQGNSDKLDLSSTIPITLNEYSSLPMWKKAVFRFVREPLIFYVVAPLMVWDLFYVIMNGTRRIVLSRGAIFLYFAAALTFMHGYTPNQGLFYGFLWEQMFTYVPGLIGLTLFHLQHSANSGYRAPDELFNAKYTAVHGSTYVTVPWYLRWITLNIEFHHIHHWSTRVPSYKLEDCHNQGEKEGLWDGITRVDTFAKFAAALPNALWCERRKRYITFGEMNTAD